MKTIFGALMVVAMSGVVNAQPNPDNGRATTWDSTYKSTNGRIHRGIIITLSGNTGRYRNANGQPGQLFNILYDTGGGTGAWFASGRWSCAGFTGDFVFQSTNQTGKSFTGYYTSDRRPNQRFSWSGHQLHIGGGNGGINNGGGNGMGFPICNQNSNFRYGKWFFKNGLWCRTCFIPGGGTQLLCWWEGRPNWIFWYNPGKRVFWCACPTRRHPTLGHHIRQNRLVFVKCRKKSRRISQCVLNPDHTATGSVTVTNPGGQKIVVDNVPNDEPLI